MLNQLIRYNPVLELLKEKNSKIKILEVGSGQNGICSFINRKIIGMDINFKDYSKDQIRINPNITPVIGDITKRTKFNDNEFDLVICVDVLEHIHPKKRKFAITEVSRISKKSFLLFPRGNIAKKVDSILDGYFKFIGSSSPLWLKEHICTKLPNEDEICIFLKKNKELRCRKIKNENVYLHLLLIIFDSLPITRTISKKISALGFVQQAMTYTSFGKTYRGGFIIEKR